jgi:selenocysteine lyase/cysteine desulfurase
MSQAICPFPALVGDGRKVRTIQGALVPYVNADNAATTPPLALVEEKVRQFLATYGSVHRGSGFNSRVSTEIFSTARQVILELVHGDEGRLAVCFTTNTTSAVNKLRRKLNLRPSDGDRLFLSEFEHSSNDLPWRECQPIRIAAAPSAPLDLDDLSQRLAQSPAHGRKLVAVTGASNLTGALTEVAEIAKVTHRYGGLLFVDAAQWVAHRAIHVEGTGQGDHIDFLAFPGHKMYAPYGSGVLIGDRKILAATAPDDLGGGTVDFVTPTRFDLTADFFRRENPGTPNAVGAVAMALAGVVLKDLIGFDAIARHEQELLDAAGERWPAIPGLRVLCELDYSAARKCAILSFVMEGIDHGLLAARLSYEFGIGVRHGHLCQFAHVAKLLGLSQREIAAVRGEVLAGHGDAMYGVVRASFGIGNRTAEIVHIGDALEEIGGTPDRNARYVRDAAGQWQPRGIAPISGREFFTL